MKLCASLALVSMSSLVLLGCAASQSSSSSQPGTPPKAGAKSNPAAAPKAEPKSEPVAAAPKAEPKADPKTEPKPVAKTDPKAEPKTEPKPVAKTEPKEAKGDVVAVVDGDKILRSEFDAFIVKVTRGQPIPPAQRAEAEHQIMDMFINQRLLFKFVETQNVEIDADTLRDAKLSSYIQGLGKKSEADALAQAQATCKELAGGADFAELAKKRSSCPSKAKGGDLGEFAPDRMVPAFSDAVKGLKVNEVSGPVKTEFGYHVIQRLALADGSDKGQLHARHILFKAKETGEVVQTLIDDLRGKSKVENKLPAPPPAPKGQPGPGADPLFGGDGE